MSPSVESERGTPGPAPEVVRETSAANPGIIARSVAVWRYRELLGNLIRKELKVKYKNSYLGFLWSLANPVLYLVVFYVVFQLILKSGIPNFAIFLLSGLLPWTFFSTGVSGATASIVGNSSLVTKVWFPREILPLSSIGAAFVHYLLQTLVLLGALVVFRWAPAWSYLPMMPLALLVLVVFTCAVGILLAAVNVYLRDTQHLVELLLLAWFWMTPIVYGYETVAPRMGSWAWVYLVNPMTDVVLAFQRFFYNRVDGPGGPILPDASLDWFVRNLAIVGVGSALVLVAALWLFGRFEGDFAEEI